MSNEEAVDRGDEIVEDPVPEVTPEEIKEVVPAAEVVAEEEKLAAEEAMIPKSRFDEVRENAKAQTAALQAELEALKQQAAANVPDPDIKAAEANIAALYDQYAELAADMKFKEAAACLKEARRIEGEVEVYRAAQFSVRARDEALDRVNMNTLIDKMETQYPVINPDHKDYDQSVVDEIKELQQLYIGRGISATASLQKASKYVLAPYNQQQPETKQDLGLERKAAEKTKAAKAATNQPPAAEAVGLGSDKNGHTISADAIMSMSQEQFAKIDEETLAKLRGDAF